MRVRRTLTHFLWIRSDVNWSVYYNSGVFKDCLLFSSIVLASLAGIWFCAGRAHGLSNSTGQRAALLLAIVVTALLMRINGGKDSHEPCEAPANVSVPRTFHNLRQSKIARLAICAGECNREWFRNT
jgi:hypothetical protein